MAEDTIKQARERYLRDKSHWGDVYQKAEDDLFFLSDDPCAQWDAADYQDRVKSRRPALTIDQLGQFIHQVSNDIRMNTPTINIIPAGMDSDVETAEIIKGRIKDIEYASNADEAYDTAATSAVKCSIGFIRVDHDYVDEEGFNQQLCIKRVINPLSCYLDAESIEADGSDAKHGTILDSMSVARFKKLYPDKDPVSFEDEPGKKTLKDEDNITIAEHFVIEEETKEIGVTESGEISEYADGIEFKQRRKITKRKVKRYKFSGADVLEETTFPGIYIPIIPVYGEEAWLKGERHIFSLIRKSKGAQQMFNYWKSLETELLMKQPQAPVMAAEGQVEDYAEDWKNPEKAMVLRYKTTDADGNPIPAPQRLNPPASPTGVINASRGAVEDIKATLGMYNASIGQRSNEVSGVAIAQRQQEGDVATFHFGDNLVRSITQVGRVLVNAMPEIEDTPRVIRTIDAEDNPKLVGINGEVVEGQERTFDLRKGKYDVKVVTGAAYTTRRQEAATFFTDLVTKQPQLMNVMGDLLFKNMDFTGAQAMAERMKKIMDPKLLEDGEQQQDPQKLQMAQQIQEMQAVIMQGQQEMAQLQEQLKSKQAELEIKAQSEITKAENEQAKHEIEMLKLQIEQKSIDIQAELKAAEIQLKSRELDLKEAELAVRAVTEAQQSRAQMPAEIGASPIP